MSGNTSSDPNKNNSLASLENVSLRLQEKQILHDVSLELQAQHILTVIGPNGAGKSTLIKILLGLQSADSGTVWRKPGLRIGYVPQKMHIDSLMPLSVERFVRLAGGSQNQALELLNITGVESLSHQPVQYLSGGEFQRVLLARALMKRPDLLVLDEPAQGIDITGQSDLYELIARLKDSMGFGVLMVSHDLHLVMQKTDQVLCLNQHICCHGEPEDVSQHPEYIRLFGDLTPQGLAVYTHHHNHCHNLHGDVVEGSCQHGGHSQDEEQAHG